MFISQWSLLTIKIKNTYIFNWFLYSFLIIKNNLYGIVFEYFNYVEHEKYQKLLIFLTGFVLSSWGLNIFFYILNYSYNISIFFFFLLLIFNIFNLIEKKLIFTPKNMEQNREDLDYNSIKILLKINNQQFKKNQSLFYIQKRYIHFNELKNIIKKHGITVMTSATAGSLFTGYLNYYSVTTQNKQYKLQQTQFEYQKEKDKADFIKWRKNLFTKKIAESKKDISLTDEKIGVLNDKIHKLQLDMDTRHFWNKVDFSGVISELKEEQNLLKRRRSSFEEELKENQKFDFDIQIAKKQKIDNNLFFDE
uniref:Uncharacterized protein n=1 Tax=Pseudoperonospora cubensis TaxID=143453 RepID=A0A0U2GJ86_PSECC|nr:hypothetical protein [Pseudoperonospora cubensis]AKZ29814.1 hypothetical protein [Pseudoperonospora cubensis]